MDPNEGGEFVGLAPADDRSVVSYLRKRKRVLSGGTVEVTKMVWREDALKVEWERRGDFGEGHAAKAVSMRMYSTFHFQGGRVMEQTVARDVNDFLTQIGQRPRSSSDQQRTDQNEASLRQRRMANVQRALHVFEDADCTLEATEHPALAHCAPAPCTCHGSAATPLLWPCALCHGSAATPLRTAKSPWPCHARRLHTSG